MCDSIVEEEEDCVKEIDTNSDDVVLDNSAESVLDSADYGRTGTVQSGRYALQNIMYV